MDIKAFKMDGLGNDFVIIDNRQKITKLTKEQIIKICDRNFIGCDQLIIIETDKSTDAYLRFFNSDGGESGACGNGTRCVADLISKEQIQELKEDNPNTKFAQWFLDPLNKNGPDFSRNKKRILDKIDLMLSLIHI